MIIGSTIISDKIISPISMRPALWPLDFFNLTNIKLTNSCKILVIITILNLPYSTSTSYFCFYKFYWSLKIKTNPSCSFTIPCNQT